MTAPHVAPVPVPARQLRQRCRLLVSLGYTPVILADGTVTGRSPAEPPLPGAPPARDAGDVFETRMAAKAWGKSA